MWTVDVESILAGKLPKEVGECDQFRASRAVNQMKLGMWFERRGKEEVCHSPTGQSYTINPSLKTCSCPDYEKRQAECKHLFAHKIWDAMSIRQRFLICPNRDHILFKNRVAEIRVERGQLVYQNGHTVKSEILVDSGHLMPDYLTSYTKWVEQIAH